MSASMTSGSIPGPTKDMPAKDMPAKDINVSLALGRQRRRFNQIVKTLCVAATAIGLLFLASILWTLLYRGIGGISLIVFTTSTLAAR